MLQWITKIEEKISWSRKTTGHLTTIINCKKTGIFTSHQKNLTERYYKKYGNTKLHTFKFKFTVLKHSLCSTSVKLKYQRKSYYQKLINQSFLSIQKQFTTILKVTIFHRKVRNERKYRDILERNLAEKNNF